MWYFTINILILAVQFLFGYLKQFVKLCNLCTFLQIIRFWVIIDQYFNDIINIIELLLYVIMISHFYVLYRI